MTVLLIALSGALFFMQTNVDAKKLTGIQVELLNCSLAPMPEVTYRLKVSKDQANKISHLLSDDAKFKSCEARVNELPDKSGNVSLKPDGKKFLMNMPVNTYEFLRQKAFNENTDIKTLILSAVNKVYKVE